MGAFDDLIPGGGGLTLSEGKSGIGKNEAQTREAQFTSTPQLRTIGRDLAKAQEFNRRIPTGRFNAKINEMGQTFPQSWQPSNVADYQSFLGLRQGMAKPLISLTAPAGSTTSSKEMDTPKELELALTSIPGPEKERQANEYLINRAGRAVLDKIAFNAFTDRWRANHGSVYDKDKRGRTAQQAFAEYQTSPTYKKTVLTPYTSLLSGGGRAPKPKAAPKADNGIKFLGFED